MSVGRVTSLQVTFKMSFSKTKGDHGHPSTPTPPRPSYDPDVNGDSHDLRTWRPFTKIFVFFDRSRCLLVDRSRKLKEIVVRVCSLNVRFYNCF